MHGFAVKRIDTGLYWNKSQGWCSYPTVYRMKNHASSAGKCHSNEVDYDKLKTVQVKITVEEQ